MDDPIKKKAEAHRAAILALQQQHDERKARYDSLQFRRSLIVDELANVKKDLEARIAKFDEEITEAQAQFEASQTALAEQRRALSQIEGGE
jgi:chromosome segregation ATPase